MHVFMKYRLKQDPPLSQAELARLLGVTRSHVNRIEHGSRQISIELLAVAVARTGLSPAALRPDLKAVLK